MLDTTHTDTDTDTYTCMHTDAYIHANMHTWGSTSLDMRCQVRIYVYAHIPLYACTYIRIYVYTCMHFCRLTYQHACMVGL
jgi:hypothetical protein